MKQVIPYTKTIDFKSNIYEISTISIDYELNIKEKELAGDFILSGEYQENEVCTTKEPFLYRLPFIIDFIKELEKDSIVFSITNFEYEVDNNSLIANIEVTVEADEKEIVIEDNDSIPIVEEYIEEETTKPDDRNQIEEIKTDILSSTDKEDNFVTYHVHIVRENDTLESIAMHYKTTVSDICLLNKQESINLGDKLIISSSNE